jgi:hypothetical protein
LSIEERKFIKKNRPKKTMPRPVKQMGRGYSGPTTSFFYIAEKIDRANVLAVAFLEEGLVANIDAVSFG